MQSAHLQKACHKENLRLTLPSRQLHLCEHSQVSLQPVAPLNAVFKEKGVASGGKGRGMTHTDLQSNNIQQKNAALRFDQGSGSGPPPCSHCKTCSLPVTSNACTINHASCRKQAAVQERPHLEYLSSSAPDQAAATSIQALDRQTRSLLPYLPGSLLLLPPPAANTVRLTGVWDAVQSQQATGLTCCVP